MIALRHCDPEIELLPDLSDLTHSIRTLEADAATEAAPLTAQLLLKHADRASLVPGIEGLSRLLSLTQLSASQLRRFLGRKTPPRGTAEFDAGQYVKQLRARFRLWSQTLEAAKQIEKGRTWPFFPRRRPILDLAAGQEAIADRVFTQMHRVINPADQANEAADLGCWPDIPTNVSLFMEHAHLAYRILLAQQHRGPMRFVDIGCGGATKVALGAQLFAAADGIEYDPGYAQAARRNLEFLGADRCRIIEGDALAFADYAAYDVLYMYRPIRDDARLIELEDHVLATARRGAVLLTPYDSFLYRTKGYQSIKFGVSVIGIDADEAEVLRRATARIGPHIAHPDRPVPAECDWLVPLWRACEANGISPDAYE